MASLDELQTALRAKAADLIEDGVASWRRGNDSAELLNIKETADALESLDRLSQKQSRRGAPIFKRIVG